MRDFFKLEGGGETENESSDDLIYFDNKKGTSLIIYRFHYNNKNRDKKCHYF